jgi:hypothetical protein
MKDWLRNPRYPSICVLSRGYATTEEYSNTLEKSTFCTPTLMFNPFHLNPNLYVNVRGARIFVDRIKKSSTFVLFIL